MTAIEHNQSNLSHSLHFSYNWSHLLLDYVYTIYEFHNDSIGKAMSGSYSVNVLYDYDDFMSVDYCIGHNN